MKFNITKIFILLALINLSLTYSFKLSSEAEFQFRNLNKKTNGIDNFKVNVGFDSEGKGILISSSENDKNDKLLRLISERLESDSYLIDFRLFRSCEMSPKISKYGKNLGLTFSPKSLENRSKNDKYDVQIEIIDFRNFINQEKYQTEEQISGYLKEKCETRKKSVELLKRTLTDSIKTYSDKIKELNKINEKISLKSIEMENLKTAVGDTQSQIKDITYLQNSYRMQLKSIDSLTNGANKLIIKENEKSLEIRKNEGSLNKKLQNLVTELKKKELEITKEKDASHRLIDSSKTVENNLIISQKNLAEEENILSNISSNKMKLSYDLKNMKRNLKKVQENVQNLKNEMESLRKVNDNKNEILKNSHLQKSEISNQIANEKIEIENIQKEINELILKKSKKEESIKTKYDQLNNKEDEISKLKLEINQNNYNVKNLEDKRISLENKDKIITEKELKSLDSQIVSVKENLKKSETSVSQIKIRLSDINAKRNEMIKLSQENKNLLSEKNEEFKKLSSEKIDIEKKINEFSTERKDKERKLRNLRLESNNYKNEINNIQKSLLSAQDNLDTFNSIFNDFSNKLKPVDEKYKNLLVRKSDVEKEIKDFKGKIKSSSKILKKETPSATIMIDLAEDEAFSSPTEDKNNKEGAMKWRQLIDNIIA